jgi:hypothetical protein
MEELRVESRSRQAKLRAKGRCKETRRRVREDKIDETVKRKKKKQKTKGY